MSGVAYYRVACESYLTNCDVLAALINKERAKGNQVSWIESQFLLSWHRAFRCAADYQNTHVANRATRS